MRILNVVYRVLVGFLFGKIKVKIQLTIKRAHEKEIARSIDANLLHQFMQRDRFPRAFAQLDELSITIEAHHLKQQDFERPCIVSKRFHGSLYTRDIAVMICPPNIDERPVATPIFIIMVGNIRCKIGWLAVCTKNDPVLIITIVRRAEPNGAILLVRRSAREENIHHVANSLRMKGTLTEPSVKSHTEIRKILSERCKLLTIGNLLKNLQAFFLGQGKIFLPITVNDALCRFDNICAMIAVLREYDILPEKLQIARIYGMRQKLHLIACIIHVVFAVNCTTGCTQEIHERRAYRSAAPMSYMERPCWIRTDIFDLNARPSLLWQCTIVLSCRENGTQRICKHCIFEVKIEESRPSSLRMIEPVS